MIDIVITSFRERETIGRAIEHVLKQDIKEKHNVWIVAPDKETLDVARKYSKKDKRIGIFKDPGKGKFYALHQILPKLKGEVIVLTDGDVFVKENSLKYLLRPFSDEKVGCVAGRPVSVESKEKLLGYWSHLLCDAGAHLARLNRAKNGKFLECSGYLWAFRNNVIKKFPLDIAEDAVVPYLFREKGYSVAYVPEAKVYVGFPANFREFIEQKKRNAKAHEALGKYVNVMKLPRTKSFKNELFEGYRALYYPRTVKEMAYTLALFPVRLYIWGLVFYHTNVKKEHFTDAWKRIDSTK
jgi:cellulose synthase/poly-beta-1,6-N-acetylglucosamine synthase-like glycosyltransferase